ncbi:MAG TPA: PAS domain-containing protein, partial [Polyangiaceae bacterium]
MSLALPDMDQDVEPVPARVLEALSATILRILSEDTTIASTLERVASTIRQTLALDAVGVRLRSGDDFPYASHDGFSAPFIDVEGNLRAKSRDSGACDGLGIPEHLDCLCGMVLTGNTQPQSPLFMVQGSFCTSLEPNSLAARHLPLATGASLRDRCYLEGFRAIALIPIRAHQQIIGLLQLNSRREASLGLELVNYFEGLSSGIGLAIMRRQAEAALVEKNAQFELALDASSMGVWYWDITTDKRVFDTLTCELLDIDPQHFSGREQDFFEHVLPEDHEIVKAALKRTIQTGARYEVEYRVRRTDGTMRHLTARGRCLLDESGRPRSIHGILWDVTQQKQTQDALCRSEEKYRLLFT